MVLGELPEVRRIVSIVISSVHVVIERHLKEITRSEEEESMLFAGEPWNFILAIRYGRVRRKRGTGNKKSCSFFKHWKRSLGKRIERLDSLEQDGNPLTATDTGCTNGMFHLTSS